MSGPLDTWRPMEHAPTDGTVVLLLVEFTEHHFNEDEEATATLGCNFKDNSGDDVWQFSGWSWEHDCFTQGQGKVIGWLPMPLGIKERNGL